MTYIFTKTMYQLIDIHSISHEGRALFWPVMRAPGRQRLARVGFYHPFQALVYGLCLQDRFARIYGQTTDGLTLRPPDSGTRPPAKITPND